MLSLAINLTVINSYTIQCQSFNTSENDFVLCFSKHKECSTFKWKFQKFILCYGNFIANCSYKI